MSLTLADVLSLQLCAALLHTCTRAYRLPMTALKPLPVAAFTSYVVCKGVND